MRSVRVIRMFLYSIREIYAYKSRSATLLRIMCLKSHSTLPPFFISQFPESRSAHRTGREIFYGTKIYCYTIFNRLPRVAVFYGLRSFTIPPSLRSGGQVKNHKPCKCDMLKFLFQQNHPFCYSDIPALETAEIDSTRHRCCVPTD